MAHLPVLLNEVIAGLDPRPGDVAVDATLGGGGHALEIIKRIIPGGKLVAIDRDGETLARTKEKLKEFSGSVTFVNDDFRNMDKILEKIGIEKIDRALFDLGMSSLQLDEAERGFSFLSDGPLDMRMDRKGGYSAGEVVNTLSSAELEKIIRDLGEERHAKLVAKAIYEARRKRSIATTGELREIIVKAVGHKYRGQKLHAAARTFQALRIYTNDELGAAEEGIMKTVRFLRQGGRVCVISFQSLEDRIVKNIFRDGAKSGELSLITKKPMTPEKEEVARNPRARSAKLRAAERIK